MDFQPPKEISRSCGRAVATDGSGRRRCRSGQNEKNGQTAPTGPSSSRRCYYRHQLLIKATIGTPSKRNVTSKQNKVFHATPSICWGKFNHCLLKLSLKNVGNVFFYSLSFSYDAFSKQNHENKTKCNNSKPVSNFYYDRVAVHDSENYDGLPRNGHIIYKWLNKCTNCPEKANIIWFKLTFIETRFHSSSLVGNSSQHSTS